MSNKPASGVPFPMPARLITLILLLVPAFAQAKSEYRACMEAQQLLNPFAGYSSTRSFRFPGYSGWSGDGGYYYTSSGYAGSGYYSTRLTIGLGSDGTAREADRISAMARKCRQFRQTKAPSFRVVAIKSPSLRATVNGKP